MKLGIALGGGGAKGMAHIGVLEALDEQGIRPQFVSGTSIGAVIGALYCLRGGAQTLRADAYNMVQSPEFKNLELDRFYTRDKSLLRHFKKEVFEKFYYGSLLFKKAHFKDDATHRLLRNLFGDKEFSDLKIPFCCNALDLESGEETVFNSGRLAEAVRASCAIPGIFPPFELAGKIFVDGGVSNNIPIAPVKALGARIVLAVYLGEKPRFAEPANSGYRILQRSFFIMKYSFDKRILAEADLVINPEVNECHWADFSSLDSLIQKGREAASESLGYVREVCKPLHRLKKRLKSFMPY